MGGAKEGDEVSMTLKFVGSYGMTCRMEVYILRACKRQQRYRSRYCLNKNQCSYRQEVSWPHSSGQTSTGRDHKHHCNTSMSWTNTWYHSNHGGNCNSWCRPHTDHGNFNHTWFNSGLCSLMSVLMGSIYIYFSNQKQVYA